MASIKITIEASDEAKAKLASLLEDSSIAEMKGKELLLDCGVVAEDLAQWLVGSIIAHHGLRPTVSVSSNLFSKSPSNKGADKK